MNRTSTDVLRLLAMAVVVLIHATAGCEWSMVKGASWWSWDGVGVIINQLGRFCVPLFVCLSGYGLAARHLSGKHDSLLAFAGGRLGRIALPYLALSVVLLASQDWRGGVLPTLEALARGQADYHLYFIPLILSCYCFFPLLVRHDSAALWWGFMLVLLAFSSPAHLAWGWIGVPIPQFDGWAPHVWLFWFYHGIRLAYADRRGSSSPGRWTLGLAIVTGIMVVGDFAIWTHYVNNPGYIDHFQRWSVVAYGLAFITAWRAWSIGARLPAAPIALFAALSFPVFLAHTQVLRLIEHSRLAGWPICIGMVTLLLTTLGVYLLHRVVPGHWPRRILGLSDDRPVAESSPRQ